MGIDFDLHQGLPAAAGRACGRRDFLKSAAGVCTAYASLATPGAASAAKSPQRRRDMVRWQAHTIAKIPNGYQVAVADVNGDGRLDVLALSSEESIVEWFENPSWNARPITTATRHNISLAPLFRSGYPERGLALASDFALNDSTSGGSVWWGEPDVFFGRRMVAALARPDSHLAPITLGGCGRERPPGLGGCSLIGLWREGAGLQSPCPAHLVRTSRAAPARARIRRRHGQGCVGSSPD